MEKVRPWCGQPSDRGRLKNRNRSGLSCWLAFSHLVTHLVRPHQPENPPGRPRARRISPSFHSIRCEITLISRLAVGALAVKIFAWNCSIFGIIRSFCRDSVCLNPQPFLNYFFWYSRLANAAGSNARLSVASRLLRLRHIFASDAIGGNDGQPKFFWFRIC